MNSFYIEDSNGKLAQLIRSFGLISDEEGICYGIPILGGILNLDKNKKLAFDHAMELFYKVIKVKDYNLYIEKITKLRQKEDFVIFVSEGNSTEINQELQYFLNELNLTLEEYLNLEALCTRIDFYYQSHVYAKKCDGLFNKENYPFDQKDVYQAVNMLYQKREEKSGIDMPSCQHTQIKIGIANIEILYEYVKSLISLCIKNKTTISLILNNEDHSICLSIDPESGILLLNANKLPHSRIGLNDDTELKEFLNNGLFLLYPLISNDDKNNITDDVTVLNNNVINGTRNNSSVGFVKKVNESKNEGISEDLFPKGNKCKILFSYELYTSSTVNMDFINDWDKKIDEDIKNNNDIFELHKFKDVRKHILTFAIEYQDYDLASYLIKDEKNDLIKLFGESKDILNDRLRSLKDFTIMMIMKIIKINNTIDIVDNEDKFYSREKFLQTSIGKLNDAIFDTLTKNVNYYNLIQEIFTEFCQIDLDLEIRNDALTYLLFYVRKNESIFFDLLKLIAESPNIENYDKFEILNMLEKKLICDNDDKSVFVIKTIDFITEKMDSPIILKNIKAFNKSPKFLTGNKFTIFTDFIYKKENNTNYKYIPLKETLAERSQDFIVSLALAMQKSATPKLIKRTKTKSAKKILSFLTSEKGRKIKHILNSQYQHIPNIIDLDELKDNDSGYKKLALFVKQIVTYDDTIKNNVLKALKQLGFNGSIEEATFIKKFRKNK